MRDKNIPGMVRDCIKIIFEKYSSQKKKVRKVEADQFLDFLLHRSMEENKGLVLYLPKKENENNGIFIVGRSEYMRNQ